MTQQVLNPILAMPGVLAPHDRDVPRPSDQLDNLQQILVEQMISFQANLTASLLAVSKAQAQALEALEAFKAEAEARTRALRLFPGPVPSLEVYDTPPSTSSEVLQDALVSPEIITRNAASRSCTESAVAVACSSMPGPSAYHYRPTRQSVPGQDHTHRHLDVSSVPTAAVKIEPQPPHSPFDLGAGDGSSSHGDDSSIHTGASSTPDQETGLDFGDEESSESDRENFSYRDTIEDGEFVDDAADNDNISERSVTRSSSPVLPTRVFHHSMTRNTRAVEEVRVSAAQPQHSQPAHRVSSPASVSSQLSQALAGVIRNNRAPNGGKRSVRPNPGTQHVYKVLKPSINPLRRKPLLVNGGIPKHK